MNWSTYPQQVAVVGSPTPTRTVACLSHTPSPTQTDVCWRGSTHTPARALKKKKKHHLIYSQNIGNTPPASLGQRCHSFTYRFTAGDDSSFACQRGARACAVPRPRSPHWRQHLPEKHLSRCHEKRWVRTRWGVNRSNCSYVRVHGRLCASLSRGTTRAHRLRDPRTLFTP